MSNRIFGTMMAITTAVTVMSLAAAPAAGQNASSRRTHFRALPEQLITPARTPDGQPDLQGDWRFTRQGGPEHSLEFGIDPGATKIHNWKPEDRQFNFLIDPLDGKIPYRPGEMAAKLTENLRNIYAPTKLEHINARSRCFLYGVPQNNVMGATIRQTSGYVVFLHPGRNTRVIPLDGRPRLPESLKLFNGDSRARFEGNTLVIETTNNNDQTWFDEDGTFHSDALRVVERLTKVDADTMYYEVTLDDPIAFSRPWKFAITWDRAKNPEREWEDECYAGHERSLRIMLQAGRRATAAGITGIHNHDSAEGSYAPTRLLDTDVQSPQ